MGPCRQQRVPSRLPALRVFNQAVAAPPYKGPRSSSIKLLAPNAITIAVQMASIAGMPAPHRRRSCSPRRIAVPVVGTSSQRSPRRSLAPFGGATMTMAPAVLAIIVAAISGRSTGMRLSRTWLDDAAQRCDKQYGRGCPNECELPCRSV